MNIHKSQLFWGSPGVPGFWPITNITKELESSWGWVVPKSPATTSRFVATVRTPCKPVVCRLNCWPWDPWDLVFFEWENLKISKFHGLSCSVMFPIERDILGDMPDFQTHPNSQIVIYIEHPSRYDYFTPKFWATGSRDETWTDRWTPGPFPEVAVQWGCFATFLSHSACKRNKQRTTGPHIYPLVI